MESTSSLRRARARRQIKELGRLKDGWRARTNALEGARPQSSRTQQAAARCGSGGEENRCDDIERTARMGVACRARALGAGGPGLERRIVLDRGLVEGGQQDASEDLDPAGGRGALLEAAVAGRKDDGGRQEAGDPARGSQLLPLPVLVALA
jgi:hypothetical protein